MRTRSRVRPTGARCDRSRGAVRAHRDVLERPRPARGDVSERDRDVEPVELTRAPEDRRRARVLPVCVPGGPRRPAFSLDDETLRNLKAMASASLRGGGIVYTSN